MGDSNEVRLVRCPKCQNLLPELPAYSVYQCGACGAVLLAKKSDSKGRDGEAKGDEFRGKLVSGVENGEGMLLSDSGIKNANNGEHEESAKQLKQRVEKAARFRSSDGVAKQRGLERREVDEFRRMRGEGSSRCYMNGSNTRSPLTARNENDMSKCKGAESVRPDREELLRKLDELKEQLSQSCDVNEKHKEKEHVDMRMFGPESYGDSFSWFPDHTSAFHRRSRQMYAPDKYFDHYHEPYVALQRPEVSMCNMYTRPPPRHISDQFNQFSCSCCNCYYKHSQHQERISPTSYRRYPSVSTHGPYFQQGCNRQRSQRPMGGGAPFVTCHDCNELLELPKKTLELDKSQWKVRCGGCSSVISFSMVDEKLTPVDKFPKKALTDTLDSSGELLHGRPYDPHGGMRKENAGFHSEDYQSPAYDFPSAERELGSSPLLSSATSEDEARADKFIAGFSPLSQCSPLEGQFDHSSTRRVVDQRGKGNLSSRCEQERIIPSKNITLLNPMKESSATELYVPPNEYSNTGVSHDTSGEEEEALPKANKGGVDSFFAGVIKKRFRDISKGNKTVENGKGSVSINGHLIPDRSVKKAEKLAGPISPGQYWYDVKAGFWGVMGRPCQGVIPPHIEVFNYPMPQNCSCGTTGVFVNGRELHSVDLDLLAIRGLPVTRDRSYIIEISGEVVDEDTGEELDSLGKLAPTVEKVKHGFGMRVPEATA